MNRDHLGGSISDLLENVTAAQGTCFSGFAVLKLTEPTLNLDLWTLAANKAPHQGRGTRVTIITNPKPRFPWNNKHRKKGWGIKRERERVCVKKRPKKLKVVVRVQPVFYRAAGITYTRKKGMLLVVGRNFWQQQHPFARHSNQRWASVRSEAVVRAHRIDVATAEKSAFEDYFPFFFACLCVCVLKQQWLEN